MAKGPGTYLYVGLKARIIMSGGLQQRRLMDHVNSMRHPHCTLMYAPVTGKTPVFHSETSRGYSTVVTEVRYIEHADVTCLILEKTRDLVKRHKYFSDMGLDLGYEFDPHVTVCQGDKTLDYWPLIGMEVDSSNEYIQVIVKE